MIFHTVSGCIFHEFNFQYFFLFETKKNAAEEQYWNIDATAEDIFACPFTESTADIRSSDTRSSITRCVDEGAETA